MGVMSYIVIQKYLFYERVRRMSSTMSRNEYMYKISEHIRLEYVIRVRRVCLIIEYVL